MNNPESSLQRTSSQAGQAIYSNLVLSIYDLWVLWFSCSFIWRCPASKILEHYNRNIGDSHLDVGVGTGYFLDRARFGTTNPEVTLLDLNENSLHAAASRIARYRPKMVRADVLEPNNLPRRHYDSIGMNFLLHCLPDGGAGKWRALEHLAPTLKESGTLFGSTIVSPWPLPHQRWLAGVYNKKGVFSNREDRLGLLKSELEKRFSEVVVNQIGVVVLFAARQPKNA
jgi:ubiquinone/menaquinone biosynthesis C-methylase UbiE